MEAIASPMPDAAPVTNAIFPVRSNMFIDCRPPGLTIPEFLNLDLGNIAIFKIYRRLACETDTRGRSGRDDVARFECKIADRYSINSATPKTICLVFESCKVSPFRRNLIDRSCGSGISSAVAINGPIGAKVSHDLPLCHWLSAN